MTMLRAVYIRAFPYKSNSEEANILNWKMDIIPLTSPRNLVRTAVEQFWSFHIPSNFGKKERSLFMQHSRITHHTINRHDHDMYNITKLQANSKLQTVSQSKCAKVIS